MPAAERACEHEAVWLDESIFRAGRKGVDDAVKAISKIRANARELAQEAHKFWEKG
jgi:predicted kinase